MTVEISLEGELRDGGIDRVPAKRIQHKIEKLIEEKIEEVDTQ